MAFGSVVVGSFVSAAAVPTSSIPTKAKKAIWNPARNPLIPLGKNPPSFHRLETVAISPLGETNFVATNQMATSSRMAMATSLMRANQNSASPKNFTAMMLSSNRTSTRTVAGTHRAMLGHQYWAYPVMAAMSPMAATIHENQYVHPEMNPAHGPSRSSAMSRNDLYLRFDNSISPRARIMKYMNTPMTV